MTTTKFLGFQILSPCRYQIQATSHALVRFLIPVKATIFPQTLVNCHWQIKIECFSNLQGNEQPHRAREKANDIGMGDEERKEGGEITFQKRNARHREIFAANRPHLTPIASTIWIPDGGGYAFQRPRVHFPLHFHL